MRLRELTTLTWGNVDLENQVAHVEARFAKNRKARDVALGQVAASILSALRPAEPEPTDHVFIGRRGEPIRDVRGGFDAAVRAVWKPKPDEQKPRFHDLRKVAATRVEAVSSFATAKAFLGHSDENVTDSYISPSLADVRAAVNRAARSIDGETPAGTIPFPVRASTKAVTARVLGVKAARGRSQALTGSPLIPEALAATITPPAKVAELVDAQVSGTCG